MMGNDSNPKLMKLDPKKRVSWPLILVFESLNPTSDTKNYVTTERSRVLLIIVTTTTMIPTFRVFNTAAIIRVQTIGPKFNIFHIFFLH